MINNNFLIGILKDDFYYFIKIFHCFDKNYDELNERKNL